MALSTQTDFYLNLNQISEMKLASRQNSADASRDVAQQFESLFIQQMLAAMRSAARIDENNHSTYTDFYQEMHDKQLALTMARQGGLGLTKFIMQQLPGGQSDAAEGGGNLPLHEYREVSKAPGIPQMNYQAENPSVIVKPLKNTDGVPDSRPVTQASPQGNWNSAQSFIGDILPQAESAAKVLGISAGLLVAQSALETGWGKHVMTRADGTSAFNLFGIKAGADWQGDTVIKPTREYRNGIMQTEMAHFRAYRSVTESLNDYVSFIQSNARYQDALAHSGNDSHYIRALHKAGYATDPDYSDKVLSILQRSELQQNLNGVMSHA